MQAMLKFLTKVREDACQKRPEHQRNIEAKGNPRCLPLMKGYGRVWRYEKDAKNI
jgi:hypothetical protein